jgi:HEPN domain
MPVYSFDIDNLSIPERHLNYSEAYLYSSKILCENLIRKPEQETYSKGCACMFNARLSVELFLKAALLKKDPNIKFHHVIDKLAILFKQHYPEKEFEWDVPFTIIVSGVDNDEKKAKMIKRHTNKQPQDQIYRYPIGKNKEPWDGVEQFSASAFISFVNEIENDMNRLKRAIYS